MLEIVDLLDEPKPNFESIWEFQKRRVDQIARKEAPEALILCEHELVATKGRRFQEGNILANDLPIFEVERGGDVTLHQPGQLVIYPLMNLQSGRVAGGLHAFMRLCEEAVIQSLKSRGIEAGRFGPTGVWVRDAQCQKELKIASIGLAVRRWVTYHGISINVSNDLSMFKKIRPCNFESSIMTSMQALGIHISLREVASDLVRFFQDFYRFSERSEDGRAVAFAAKETLGGGTAPFKIPANF